MCNVLRDKTTIYYFIFFRCAMIKTPHALKPLASNKTSHLFHWFVLIVVRWMAAEGEIIMNKSGWWSKINRRWKRTNWIVDGLLVRLMLRSVAWLWLVASCLMFYHLLSTTIYNSTIYHSPFTISCQQLLLRMSTVNHTKSYTTKSYA